VPITVAIQGERGSFSQEAAHKLLGSEIALAPCRTFEDVFSAVTSRAAACAVIPIENSLAGSVHRNYELLAAAGLTIDGEVFLRISHNLIGRPGARLEDIRRVVSHPVALAQCQRFLAAHPAWEVLASYDTAGSVKEMMESGRPEEASIASAAAAELYGGHILISEVEDHGLNYTRFLLLAHPGEAPPTVLAARERKTTVLFRTPNRAGALFRALAVFALRDINLTKIESRPIEGRPWEYSFTIDVNGDLRDPNLERAIENLREMCEIVRVLGCYPAGSSAN
jgi:prephenate dehydratase